MSEKNPIEHVLSELVQKITKLEVTSEIMTEVIKSSQDDLSKKVDKLDTDLTSYKEQLETDIKNGDEKVLKDMQVEIDKVNEKVESVESRTDKIERNVFRIIVGAGTVLTVLFFIEKLIKTFIGE